MTVNEYFMKYYNPTKSGVNRKHKLIPIIQYGWCLSYEQVTCDCLVMGYSLCIVEPLVERIYKQMDEQFSEWEASYAFDRDLEWPIEFTPDERMLP